MSLKGRRKSKDECVKLSASLTGRQFSEEHKRNLRNAQPDKIGKNNPMFGKAHSDTTKNLIRTKLAKMWEITWPDGHMQVIKSLKQFCREHGLCRTNMARGRYKRFKCKKIS